MNLWPALGTASETLVTTLGREAWLAALLFLLVAPIARLLRGRAPAFVHALWALVLVRLVVPVSWATSWSARAILDRWAGWEALSSRWLGGAEPDLTAHVGGLVPTATELVSQPTFSQAPSFSVWGSGSLWPIALTALWMLGVATSLGVWWLRRRRYVKVLAASRPVVEERALALLSEWRGRLGLRRSVRLLTADAAVTPFTTGVLRPVIFLPTPVLARGEASTLEAVIAHEVAHVRRLDALWLFLQHVVRALYFFHPVAWIASSRLADTRETLCDRLVLSRGRLAPRAYGRSLLAVLSLTPRSQAPAASAFVVPSFAAIPNLSNPATRSALRAKRRLAMRLSALLRPNSTSRPRTLLSWGAAFLLALFLLPMAGMVGGAAEAEGAAQETSTFQPAFLAGGLASTWKDPQKEVRRNSGRLINPMPAGGEITSTFGERKNPFSGKMAHHRGVDVKAAVGTPVVAAADGVVEVATARYHGQENWGTVIILDHGDGLKTFYSHLDSLEVEQGQRVLSGESIGAAGETGQVTGPHLHFEVWEYGDVVDPAMFVAEWDNC